MNDEWRSMNDLYELINDSLISVNCMFNFLQRIWAQGSRRCWKGDEVPCWAWQRLIHLDSCLYQLMPVQTWWETHFLPRLSKPQPYHASTAIGHLKPGLWHPWHPALIRKSYPKVLARKYVCREQCSLLPERNGCSFCPITHLHWLLTYTDLIECTTCNT